MTVELSLSSRDEQFLTLNASYGAAQSLDIQYASRSDFQFCVAPVIPAAAQALVTLQTLNRAATYWVRGREVAADGTRATWSPAKAFTTAPGADNLPNYPIQIGPAVIVLPIRPSSWSAGATVAGYPVENMGRPSPVAAWRGTVAAGQVLFSIETDGSPIDTIALLDTNLPNDAQIQVIAGPTLAHSNGGTAPAYSGLLQNFRVSENLPGRRGYHGLVRLPGAIEHRFIGIKVFGALPPVGLVHITHAVFGKARVVKNYGDMTDQPFDLSTMERMRDGTPDAVAGFRGRRIDFELAAMTEAQHEASFADLAQRVGLSEPVFVIPNSRAGAYLHDRLLYGNLTANRQTNSNARFTRSLSIESVIN